MAARAQRVTFAAKLREALDGKGVSVRGLARTINPLSPETARSNLMRWLRGSHEPSRISRRAVAEALGLPADFFEDTVDDGEPRALARRTEDVGAMLDVLIAALVEARDTQKPRGGKKAAA